MPCRRQATDMTQHHYGSDTKGFVLVTLSRAAARGDLVAVSTIVERAFTVRTAKSFEARPEGSGISALKAV